ncbi:MAG: formylglycine-generating enzyme family protein [Fibrobacterota bacterium]|nr:formylglycine-generating enzyme family protein [Fibrobacterota bacterium]
MKKRRVLSNNHSFRTLLVIVSIGLSNCSLFSNEDSDPIPPAVDIVMADSTGRPESCAQCPVMKHIAAGAFDMGADSGDGKVDYSPKHRIFVSAFWMDSVEVTQSDYLAMMGKNPAYFNGATERHGNVGVDLNRPVEKVAWFEAALYCNARSKKAGLDTVYRYTGIRDSLTQFGFGDTVKVLDGVTIDYAQSGFRLPTEAEWEYACRAGTQTLYYWGDDFRIFSYYAWLDAARAQAVAQKRPNAWGLYDMLGNVREWTGDWYADYNVHATENPTGPVRGSGKVQRGLYYSNVQPDATVSRWPPFPEVSDHSGGFRCVLPIR